MAYFTTDDNVQLYYTDEGKGDKTLLLMHGFSGTSEHYYKVAPALAEHYRVVRYDQRAHGRSETPKHGYTMNRMARDADNLIRHLNLQNVTMVGWSMSSNVAYAYLKEFGDAGLDKIVITVMTPQIVNRGDYAMGMAGFTYESCFDYMLQYSTNFLDFMKGTYNGTFWKPEAFPEDIAWLNEDMKVLDPGAMMRCLIALAAVDHWDVLPTITKPTLILAAEHDIFPLEGMKEQQRRIPNAQFAMIEDCGHMHALERPDEYVRILRDFVG